MVLRKKKPSVNRSYSFFGRDSCPENYAEGMSGNTRTQRNAENRLRVLPCRNLEANPTGYLPRDSKKAFISSSRIWKPRVSGLLSMGVTRSKAEPGLVTTAKEATTRVR